MKNLIRKIMTQSRLRFAVYAAVLFLPLILLSVQMNESLKDDVTAMITNARKLAHTTFLIDTSESMNQFAFSDYINTCSDAEANINHAIALCDSAYSQCRTVESNAMCGVNLGCGDILTRCTSLRATRTSINSFCTKIDSIYSEPGKTTTVADPLGGGANDARKFVGPWDPRRADYMLDLCFYNWTEDTGGDVMDGTNSGHYSNNGAGAVDRRDWDCMTDGVASPELRSGLWLNWKYSTSLDAVKIIFADTHQFAYPPRARGERKCMKTEYFPYKDDHLLGKICYREFETAPADPATMTKIKDQVRANWSTNKTIVADTNCPGTDTFQVDTTPPTKDTTVPGDPLSVDADTVPCNVCYDYEGNEVSCEEYSSVGAVTNALTAINGITATVDYSCCSNFECTNPKCRDDDTSCRSDGGACVLGYYSDFDQDQNHCCDMLSCIEPADPATCAAGGTYLPGPGNDFTTSFEDSLGMPSLVAPDKYQNVTVTVETSSLTFGATPANVDKVVINLFYGCDTAGVAPSTPLGSKTYTAEVTTAEPFISTAIDLSGCDQSGYKVGGTMQIFHSGANFSTADVSLDLDFFVSYDSGSDQTIKVLDPALFYYFEYKLKATGAASDRVNEYECKTTMYHKQSMVVSGGSGSCPSKHPSYAHCVYPDHMTIAADQWGNPKKTACSWLCRDDAVYDDVWKCRSFFAQMDNPARGGSGICGICEGDNPLTLENCCVCINGGSYQFLNLEPPETVKFAAAGPSYNCSVSGFEEGETSDGDRTFTSAFMAEVIEGHIKELGDSSYRLNVAGYVSPYSDPTNKWYYDGALINKSNSFLANSFVSVFETGKNGTRDTACIYDLLNNFNGEDCMDCLDLGCCSVDIGGGSNMCDYPSFWMKIPNTEGGQLIYPANVLSGGEVTNFKNMMKALQARGGASLGETLFDIWRYLGGMYSIYDPNHNDVGVDAPYTSPFQGSDAACYLNDVVIVSGGQPQFDDNYTISTKTSQATPADVPYVIPDGSDVATAARPYVETNWYLTALEDVADWIHTKDFYHTVDACRVDNNVNVYGYEVGGSSGGHDCSTAGGEDESDLNVVERIHAVAIGDWALAPLYNNPGNTYLESSVMQNAATNNGGQFFGLTAEAANQVGDTKTFHNLTDMFDSFVKQGSPYDRAAGRGFWSTSLVNPYREAMRARGPEAYSSAAIPVDNRVSRFWIGNLKKFTKDDDSSGCDLLDLVDCNGWNVQEIPSTDCFAPTDAGADISDVRLARMNAGGAAKVLQDRMEGTAIGCSATVGAADPCYNSGARNILYDDNTALIDLQGADPAWFRAKFNMTYPGITLGESVQILDYMYGYDAFDDDSDGNRNEVRFSEPGTRNVTVDDAYDISFSGTTTMTIRPTLLGSIYHSRPMAVHYNDSNTTRIFVGANDGMMHSFDQDGNEAFAYIPMPVLPQLTNFLDPREGIFFNSAVDGPVALMHIDYSNDGIINGGEQAYLIFGYRRGANYYTILDISELDNPKFVQHIPVEGQSWGKPLVFRKCMDDTAGLSCTKATDLKYYLALPGGYDPCFDEDNPACPLNAGGHLDPDGNHIYVYEFNGASFDQIKDYTMGSVGPGDRDDGWLRVSFVARPFAINTEGYLAQDTEFVYFADLSGTVFRIDVREEVPADWKLRAVFNQRAAPQPIVWGTGIKTYTGNEFYPPLDIWKSAEDATYTKLIPIPLATGNAANLNASEIDEFLAFYDRYDYPDLEAPISANDTKNMTNILADHGAGPQAGFDGWKHSLIDDIKEKVVRRPLIVYDRDKYNTYSMSLNSYIPSELGQCRSWGGLGGNYTKSFINGVAPKLGSQEFQDLYRDNTKWTTDMCSSTIENDFATEVSIIQNNDGTLDMSFNLGDKILVTSDPVMALPENPANIIKWYELY